MGKGGYNGGSSIVSRSGWALRPGRVPVKDAPFAAGQSEPREVVKARKVTAQSIRAQRADGAQELAARAADLLRAEGLSEREIRKRLKLKRKPK